MISNDLEFDDRRVIIIEKDSGVGWAVAFIVLALAIGFGIIIFMDQQSMVEYKIEQALDRMQENRFKRTATAKSIQSDEPLMMQSRSLASHVPLYGHDQSEPKLH